MEGKIDGCMGQERKYGREWTGVPPFANPDIATDCRLLRTTDCG
jgi:hypothetical protein